MPIRTNRLVLLLFALLQACSNGTSDENSGNKLDSSTHIRINNSQTVVGENFALNVSCSGIDCSRLYYQVNNGDPQGYQQNTIIDIASYADKLLQLRVVAKTDADVVSAEVIKDFYVDTDAPVSTININGGGFALAPTLDISCDDSVDAGVPQNGIAGCKEIWASLSDSNYVLVKNYSVNGGHSTIKMPAVKNGDKLYFYSVDSLGNKESVRSTNPFYIDTLYGLVRNTSRSTLNNAYRISWDAPIDTRYNEFLVCRSSVSRSDICADADIVAQGTALFVDDNSPPLGDVYYQIFSRMPGGQWLTPPRENGPQTFPGVSNLSLAITYQQVKLDWSNPSASNVDFVKVFRKTSANPDPTFSAGGLPDLTYEIKHFDYTSGALVPVTGSYIDNTGLVEGETYYYAVYVEYSGTNYSQPRVELSTMPVIMKIIDTSPAASATGVARNIAQISLSSSDALDSSRLKLSPLQLSLSYGIDIPYVDAAITAQYDVNAANRILFGVPRLALNAEYLVHFDADIRSLQNAPLDQAHQFEWRFTSADGAWGVPHTLLNTSVTDLQHPLRAQVDSNEHVVVVWQQNTSPAVIVSREGSAGVDWKPATVDIVSNASYASIAPKLAMNKQGQAVAAWIQQQAGLPDSLYIRRYLPAVGWDSAGAHLIQQSPTLIQTYTGASSDFNVVDFALDINDDGDVFVLWDVKDNLGNGDLSLNSFSFDNPAIINSYTVLASSSQHSFSELNMVLQNRSASLPGTGIARCAWVDSGTGIPQLKRYSIRFDANASAIANAPQALPSVHAGVVAPFTSFVSMEQNAAKDIALSWVESYSAGTSGASVEYDVVSAQFSQSNSSWSVPVKLASLGAMPSTRLATAIASNGDMLIVWDDANASQANYAAYFDATQQAWEANPTPTGAGNFTFLLSNQSLSHIGVQIDEAGNSNIVATTLTGVYALRKPHSQNLQTWTGNAGLPFMTLFNNGAGFVSGRPSLIHNRLGESLAFWVGGSASFVYPGFNLLH